MLAPRPGDSGDDMRPDTFPSGPYRPSDRAELSETDGNSPERRNDMIAAHVSRDIALDRLRLSLPPPRVVARKIFSSIAINRRIKVNVAFVLRNQFEICTRDGASCNLTRRVTRLRAYKMNNDRDAPRVHGHRIFIVFKIPRGRSE